MRYDEAEIERIGRAAFDTARARSGRLCSVDKANVLDVSQLWRDIMNGLAGDYPDVELTHMYVDNAAMHLVRAPKQSTRWSPATCSATFSPTPRRC